MKKIFLLLLLLISLHFIFIKINQWQLPKKYIEKTVTIIGVIHSIPEKKSQGVRFEFYAQSLNNQKISAHFLLYTYHAPLHCHAGEQWQLTVKLKPLIGLHNPGGFNYVDFLLTRGISATGYVVTRNGDNQLLQHNHSDFIDAFREHIHDVIFHTISNTAIAAFISAISVGLRDELTESDWQVFQKTGTNHLIAIAGLHIGFVFACAYFFTQFLCRRFATVLLWLPASRAAEMVGLIAAMIYATLSGFAIPAQRALIMLCCLIVLPWLNRFISIWQRLIIACLIVLLINPYHFIDSSFWLSFISIAILTWVLQGRLHSSKPLVSWVKIQWALVIGLLPLMLFYFQQASLIAFFTNAIAIPWVGLVILPLSCIAVLLFFFNAPVLSQKIFFLSGKLLFPLWKLLQIASHFSFASWHHGVANLFILIVSMIAIFFLLAPGGLPARWVGCVGLLPLFFYHPAHPELGDFRATVIDVGQGLSVLIQTARHVMLYDTGSHIPGGIDMGESVVAPYLRTLGISTINRLEISHGDNDHSGGAASIIHDFMVNTIFTSAPNLVTQFHAQYCTAGQNWNWDQVHFETLNPQLNETYADNNSSCVIKITGKNGSVLLTGDIESEIEKKLLQQYADQLRATVLIVPHHGSDTSSSDAFIEAVSPRDAIISAGKYNHYHLPNHAVVQRYIANHITVENTANCGAIMIRFPKQGDVKLSGFG